MSRGFQQPRPITEHGNNVFHQKERSCASGDRKFDVPKEKDGEKPVRSDLCGYKDHSLEDIQLSITSVERVHSHVLKDLNVQLKDSETLIAHSCTFLSSSLKLILFGSFHND